MSILWASCSIPGRYHVTWTSMTLKICNSVVQIRCSSSVYGRPQEVLESFLIISDQRHNHSRLSPTETWLWILFNKLFVYISSSRTTRINCGAAIVPRAKWSVRHMRENNTIIINLWATVPVYIFHRSLTLKFTLLLYWTGSNVPMLIPLQDWSTLYAHTCHQLKQMRKWWCSLAAKFWYRFTSVVLRKQVQQTLLSLSLSKSQMMSKIHVNKQLHIKK